MAEQRKTQATDESVTAYLESVADERRRADAQEVLALMQQRTGAQPRMWGSSMIGFGTMRYTGSDRVERETMAIGLSPRKAALTLYGLTYYGSNEQLLARLGPHTTGKGCLYLKRLSDVDRSVLGELIDRGWATNHHG